MTVLLRRTIRSHLRRSRPAHKNRETLGVKRETRVSLWPAVSHLAASPSPRHEGNVGQAPRSPNITRLTLQESSRTRL